MSIKSYKSLGERIKDDMKERGINGSAVARKMKVARQVINQIDRRKKFDIEFLLEFKEASGLDYTRYAFENLVAEPPVEYSSSNNVTLTLNVGCPRDRVSDFSLFLSEVETLGRKYQYVIK